MLFRTEEQSWCNTYWKNCQYWQNNLLKVFKLFCNRNWFLSKALTILQKHLDRFSITRENWHRSASADDERWRRSFLPERAVPLLGDLSLALQEELGSGVRSALGEKVGGQTSTQAGAIALLQQRVRRDTGCNNKILLFRSNKIFKWTVFVAEIIVSSVVVTSIWSHRT